MFPLPWDARTGLASFHMAPGTLSNFMTYSLAREGQTKLFYRTAVTIKNEGRKEMRASVFSDYLLSPSFVS